MVLAELGQRLTAALGSLNNVAVVDEAVSAESAWPQPAAAGGRAGSGRSLLLAPACHSRALANCALLCFHCGSQVLDACLKEIATALLQADVNVRLVANMRSNVKKRVNVEQVCAGWLAGGGC